jgi:hypothetical protein
MPGIGRREMKIEVLYVPGCPNHKPAVEAVTSVLAAESVRTEVCDVPVHSKSEAQAFRFPGSPTVRVNGNDVEPDARLAFGLACRLYANGRGVPSEAAIRRAVADARQKE